MKKKILDFAKEHKFFAAILFVALIFFVMLVVVTIMLFVGHGSNAYGDRLDGIKDVKISDKKLDTIEENLANKEGVEEVKVRLQGKIVYADIYFAGGTNIDAAKEVASSILEEFDEDELDFYDIEVLISEKKTDEKQEGLFNAIGTKHPSKDTITWNKG